MSYGPDHWGGAPEQAQRPQPQQAPGAPARRQGGGVPDGLLLGTLGLLLCLTVLTWLATGLAGLVSHGRWPDGVAFPHTAPAMRSFLTAPSDVPAAWSQADPATLPGATTLWLVFLVLVVIVFSTVMVVALQVARWRAQARSTTGAEPEPGPTSAPETKARAKSASAAPEAVPNAPAVEAEAADGPQVPAPVALLRPVDNPARATGTLVTEVLAAPAGLVVLDPDGSVWSRTTRQRTKLGPVHVYDPGHTTDAPVRLRWAPQHHCDTMAVARRRAVALLAPVRPTEPVFQLDADAAETLLRCYLHAASLANEPIQHVHRWSQGKSPGEPSKILRTHPRVAGGASMELESTLTAHPGRRDAALDLVNKALGSLDQVHIRQACTPGRVDALALDNLTGEGGTLYIVGSDQATAALRSALLDEITTAQPTLVVLGGGPN